MGNHGLITLLLVEDDLDLLSVLRELLEDHGFEVKTANSGNEAFDWLRHNSVRAIISDIDMPNGKGTELLLKLRRVKNETPLFLMTGGISITKTSAIEMGATGLFFKPEEMKELISAVTEFLSSIEDTAFLKSS